MTPQELKDSILQLAMRGRLVPQVDKEGSGQQLYKKIEAEKAHLGIKTNKKIEPITEEIIPFDIPDNWCWVRFGNIVSYHMGKTPPRAEPQWWEDDFPWVSIADMPENGHICVTKEKVSKSAIFSKFNNKISKAGTMIMSFKLTVGRVSILDIDAVHNEAIISIYPYCDGERIIQSYLFHLLPIITQYGDSKNAIKGKTLNDTSISNLLIPLPPLAEQKRIVTKIEELSPYIDHYEQVWSRLDAFNKRFPSDMQKSLLQMAIQGKLVEQRPEEGTAEELYKQIQAEKQRLIKEGKIKKEKPLPEIAEDEVPFEIPESWKWVHFCHIAESGLGKTLDKVKNTGELKPYLCSINVYWNGINLEKVKEARFEEAELVKYRLQRGDLLICEGGDVGRSAVWENDRPMYYQNALHRVRFYCGVNPYFYKYLIEYYKGIGIIDRFSKGVTIKHFVQSSLNAIWIPLPPLSEQERIVARLEELLPLCERLLLNGIQGQAGQLSVVQGNDVSTPAGPGPTESSLALG